MTLSDGPTTTFRAGDVVNLKDDHQYRVLKIIVPSGPIVLKRTDGSTYCSFLCTPPHVLVSALQMVTQSTQTDPPLSATDDPLALAILQSCGLDAIEAYHQGRPYCLGDIHWVTLPETTKSARL